MTLETKPKHNAGNEQKNKLKKETIVIAAFDTDPRSRDIAKEKMTANKEELKGIRGFWKKIWTHNLAKNYYEHKEMEKARRIIKDSGNIYSNEKGDEIDNRNAMKALTEATVKKFTSEYEEEMIHTEAGEKKKSLKEETPEEKAFKSKIQELITRYAKEEINEEQFLSEKGDFINNNFGKIKDEKGEGLAFKNSLYADNLLEVARQVKQKFRHTGSLDALDLDFDIVLGKSKTGARTEANLDWTEKTIKKITETIPGGILVNEAALALIVSVASKVAMGSVRRFSKILGPLGFVASAGVGGMVAGIKESGRLKEDRAQHSREMAEGKKFSSDAERRKEMEGFRYETKGADEMTEKLQKSLKELQSGKINENSLNSVLNNLKEIEARISYSDRKNIDLIHYSDTKNIEQERMGLDFARAESGVFLRKIANGEIGGFDKSGFSFLKNKEALEKHLEEIKKKHIEDFFQKEISEKNEAFEKMRVKEVWKSFKKGALIGAGVGFVAQELASAFGIGHNQGLLSVKEAYAGDGTGQIQHFTALEYLRRYMSGDMPRMDASKLHETIIGDNHFKLPEGADFHKNADGTFDLLRNGKSIAGGLSVNENGGLTDESRNILQQEGIFTAGSVNKIDPLNAKEYLSQHKDVHSIKRDLWYDNDTPKPIFDKNELKLHMGGVRGIGVDKEGNFIFNVKHMQPDGSYHKDLSVDAQEAMQSGKLKILLSLSKDTQGQVFEVPIDANGNAVIDPNSEMGRMFFENHDGQALFKGKFAEVAEMMDQNDGKNLPEHVKILATHVGEETLPKEVPTTIFDIPEENEVDWPVAVPILGRRPLEPIIHGPSPDQPPHPFGYSERLKNHFTEISSYRNSEKNIEKIISSCEKSEDARKKYEKVFKRLNELRKSDSLPKEKKEEYEKELEKTNKKLFGKDKKRYLLMKDYIGREINRIYQQFENISIEEAKVGEKPFPKEFYESSPLIKGVERAEDIILILDYPLGDAVMTIPILHVFREYFKQNGFKKNIRVVTTETGLFESLEDQFPGLVKLVNLREADKYFKNEGKKERFIINAHKGFDEYAMFGLSPSEVNDLSKVMSVDWASWMKEEAPRPSKPGFKKLEMIPQRIMRNFEVMFGQKIFNDIRKVDKFIEPSNDYETDIDELSKKYNIKADEKIIVISAGSSVVPKEYTPENWEKVIVELNKKFPNSHILFLDDLSPVKKQKYGALADKLKGNGINISRVSEGLDKMNAIMNRADVVITPDTGLGHYASMAGTPNIMFILGDPVQWSGPNTIRINHETARKSYETGQGPYGKAWEKPDDYFVEDNGKKVGASDIKPERIIRRAEKVLG